MEHKKARRSRNDRAPKTSAAAATRKAAQKAADTERLARVVGRARRKLLDRFPAVAASERRRQLLKIERSGGGMPDPLLRWIEDDLAFTASALEELGFRLDRYRFLLLKDAAFDQADAALDREAQLVGILGVAVERIEDAHGILQYRRSEAQLDYQAGGDEPVGGLEATPGVAGPRD